MTTGARAAAACVMTIALAATGALRAESEWGVEDLMRSLKSVESSRARYFERKELAILNAPLESFGTLVYRAPGRLEKHTLSPEREKLILDNGRLMFENVERGWHKSFTLREHPVIWAFVESIRSTLAGDLPTLKRFYRVELEGDESSWWLRLQPREPEMKAVIDEIRISGSETWINRIETLEAGGDRTVMKIEREAS